MELVLAGELYPTPSTLLADRTVLRERSYFLHFVDDFLLDWLPAVSLPLVGHADDPDGNEALRGEDGDESIPYEEGKTVESEVPVVAHHHPESPFEGVLLLGWLLVGCCWLEGFVGRGEMELVGVYFFDVSLFADEASEVEVVESGFYFTIIDQYMFLSVVWVVLC